MIRIRLVEGRDYAQNAIRELVDSFGLAETNCGSNSTQLFQQLAIGKQGGILVAENDDDRMVAWMAFLDKGTAERLSLPTVRFQRDLHRLVSAGVVIDPDYRGKGLGEVLARELIDLAKEWNYQGVEISCRGGSANIEPNSEDLMEAGFVLAEQYPGDIQFLIMEYSWADQIQ